MNLPKFQLTVAAPPDAPFAALGVRCGKMHIFSIDYLPHGYEKAMLGDCPEENEGIGKLERQLNAYLHDREPVRYNELQPYFRHVPVPSSHQKKVWNAALGIAYGECKSYGDIAEEIGMSPDKDARVVGQACGKNRIGIVVPVFRVVGKRGNDYTLGGYSKGNPNVRDEETKLEIKAWLLEHEGCQVIRRGSMPEWIVRPAS